MGALRGRGAVAPEKKKNGIFLRRFLLFLQPFLVVFKHLVFIDGFLILVKELGLMTNLGQWIRSLDATGSYRYIVL
jgi:hypothetical protein